MSEIKHSATTHVSVSVPPPLFSADTPELSKLSEPLVLAVSSVIPVLPLNMMNTLVQIIHNRGYQLNAPYSKWLHDSTWQDPVELANYWKNRQELMSATRYECPKHIRTNQKDLKHDSSSKDSLQDSSQQHSQQHFQQHSQPDPDDLGCRLLVIKQPSEHKVGKPDIVQLLQTYQPHLTQSCDRIILIYNHITPVGRKQLMQEPRIHTFTENQLRKNIIEHEYVSKHRKLSEQEEKAVLDKHKTGKHKLPNLSCVDPIARYYGFEPGDVIECIRRFDGALAQCPEYFTVARVDVE